MQLKNLPNSDILNPLSAWLNQKQPLPNRFYRRQYKDKPNEDWFVWLHLQEMGSLHRVNSMNWISLKDSIVSTRSYLDEARELINGLEGAWLDSFEKDKILSCIGNPPMPCLPLYIITCSEADKTNEKVVYIGKTKNQSRFANGHNATLRLHDPVYDGKIKQIYRGVVWFYFNDEYIVLDWIRPEQLALELLDSIESQMIFSFKPELNINKKTKNRSKWTFLIHIQNTLGSKFLNDSFV